MKQAGLKNQGAWYRANKFIKSLASNADRQADLVNAIKEIDSFPGFVAALLDIAEKTGDNGAGVSDGLTTDSLGQQYGTVGIPLLAWMGVLAFDTFTKGTNGKYKADHAKAVATFASDLRRTVSQFKRARRLIADALNMSNSHLGNPGGIADATKDVITH